MAQVSADYHGYINPCCLNLLSLAPSTMLRAGLSPAGEGMKVPLLMCDEYV